MAYVNSSHIKIYPSAYRGPFDPESYLNTEYNITHTKALSSVINSFAFEKSETEGASIVDYVYMYIKGYYFKCSKINILNKFDTLDTSKPIWAQIRINTESITTAGSGVTYTNAKLANLANSAITTLDSTDETPVFQGIAFTNAEDEPEEGYTLKLLEYNSSSSSWKVPSASKTKLDTSEILDDDNEHSIKEYFSSHTVDADLILTRSITSDETSSVLDINGSDLTLEGDISLPANSDVDGTFVYGQERNTSGGETEITPLLITLGTGSLAIPRRDANGDFNAETATLATSATNVAGGSEYAIPYQTAVGTTSFITKNEGSDKMFLSQTDGDTPMFSVISLNDLPTITNAKLANSSITLWGKSISLGGEISNIGRLDNLKTKDFKAFAGAEDDDADANCVAIEWSGGSPALKVKGGIISCTGNIVSTGGAVQGVTVRTTSDARLKENVVSYTSDKSILDLDVKKFDFINGVKNQIGCLAQDLKEICPEIVSEDENGYLSIQESKIVYLLLNEVKKLKEELEKINKK